MPEWRNLTHYGTLSRLTTLGVPNARKWTDEAFATGYAQVREKELKFTVTITRGSDGRCTVRKH